MMWFCGGHGVCLTGAGPKGHIEAAVVAWLKRYVGQRHGGRHRPGVRVARRRRPVALHGTATRSRPGAPVTASGTGTLVLNPPTSSRGTIATAGRAVNAVNVPVTALRRRPDRR